MMSVLRSPTTMSFSLQGVFHGPNYALNGVGVVWVQVAYQNEPALVPRRQLGTDDIWTVFLVRLHHEVRRLSIE